MHELDSRQCAQPRLQRRVFVLALFTWAKSKSALALLTGIAFGLFAISHLVVIFGLAVSAEGLIVLLRVFGYGLVLAALYKEMLPKKQTPPTGNALK